VPGGHDALVLLHGLGHSADVWLPVLAADPGLARSRPVVALDLPGHGEAAPMGPHVTRVADVADAVGRAVAGLGVRAPVWAGHSLGGRVALELASRAGAAPVVLIDTCPAATAEARGAVARHVATLSAGAADLGALVERVGAGLPLADPAALTLALGAMAKVEGGRARVRVDEAVWRLMNPSAYGQVWPLLAAHRGPLGVVRGEFSSFVSKADVERMMQVAVRPLGLETVLGAGHAIPLEQPRGLAAALARTLEALGRGGGRVG
jgi:pimeloyl-ACP methyl ester carboxylesterase